LCTGDLVRVVGDRVFFAGRQGDTINVGGNKVQPFRVESLLRSVTGVADVRVFGVASSITGQLVACQVVPASGVTNDQLRGIIQEIVNRNLASHERPRFIEFKNHIELTKAGKISRASGSEG
jgi:acyl-coenzyme A synthetase/AMP-(fatty) acid ligase